MKRRKKIKKKTCGSKIKHKSKDGAYGEKRSILKKSFVFHKLGVYKCPFCGFWHVGKGKEIKYERFDELK